MNPRMIAAEFRSDAYFVTIGSDACAKDLLGNSIGIFGPIKWGRVEKCNAGV